MHHFCSLRSLFCCGLLACFAALSYAQQAPAPRPTPPPQVTSPEVHADRRVTFRLFAPQATTVRVTGGDMPAIGQGKELTKDEQGIWEITVGPIDAGAYRYQFNVNGVPVIDPRNPATSESNANVWSLVYVPGSEVSDTKQVPRGAVAKVTYYSTALSKFRRMHVYTPPGYELGKGKYPIFYLLHGASDSDESWSSVGRAGFIFDNLIAAGKAKPMIVVMPAGHTRLVTRGAAPAPASASAAPTTPPAPPPDEFLQEFTTDIMPYAERNYRVLPGRANRAMAGLSMGGGQTLNIALPQLEKFAYIGVFSSGLLSAFTRSAPGTPPPANPNALPALSRAGETWLEKNQAKLMDKNLKKGVKLLWFATGKDDFLLGITKATVELLKQHGFQPVYQETAGGHTWMNWRNYLNEFAPQLFR